MSATARRSEATGSSSTLHRAWEPGAYHWKLGFTTGLGREPRYRTIAGGNREALQEESAAAKQRFDLSGKAWRRKTDNLDLKSLLRLLGRYWILGEDDACNVVNGPSREDEDQRQLHREWETLRGGRTARASRIESRLAPQGRGCIDDGPGWHVRGNGGLHTTVDDTCRWLKWRRLGG